jgi:galactonate dehydratase
VLHVSARTNWSFVAVQTSDGQTFWGEGSLNGWEPMLQGAVEMLGTVLVGLTCDKALTQLTVSPFAPGGLVHATAVSALTQALLEWSASHRQVAWHEALEPGNKLRRPQVRAYANINRATQNRTPEGFAATAKQAMAQGFSAFKAAPFDGLLPSLCATKAGQQYLRHGIDCMLAMRDTIGPEARLMVDCHWRLDEQHAEQLLKDLIPARLHWFECPLPEIPKNFAANKRLRQIANDLNVLTAGAETLIGVQGFTPLFEAGTYDVVMPDVKYCGGPWAMLEIAKRAHDAGVQFSPHNPTGPLASLHSLNIAGIAPECDMVELQFEESPMFEALLPDLHPNIAQGGFAIPVQPGMRALLRSEMLRQHPYAAVPMGVETLSIGEGG